MNTKLKNLLLASGGIAVGIINGMLGAGGGLIAVPLLKKYGLSQPESHAASLAVMLPLSSISAYMYLSGGTVSIYSALPYLLPGVLGAAVGALVLYKISPPLLRKIFAVIMLYSGIRLILK